MTRRHQKQDNASFKKHTHSSGYQTNLFCIPNHYEDSVANVMIPYGLIMDRIEKLARDCFYDMLGQGRFVASPSTKCT